MAIRIRCGIIHIVVENTTDKREWLSGGASPCQGEGRGFDSRLALFFILRKARGFCFLCYISTERNDIRNVALFLYGVNGQTDVAGGTFA